MKNAYLYKSSIVIKIALATAILLIAYITVVFFNQMQTLSDSVSRMSNANRKLIEMEELLNLISVNESTVRSFIISKDSVYLEKRFKPKADAMAILQKLDVLNKEMPSKNLQVARIRKMVDDRFQLFQELSVSAATIRPDRLNYVLATSDLASDQIKRHLRHAMKDEAAVVNKNEIEHRFKIETSILTSFFLVTVALIIILLSLNRINSDLSSLKKLNDDLRFLNFTFNNAEKIAGISHWKYNLQTQKFSFSNNFFLLLGMNPEENDLVDITKILEKLHPEDCQKVVDAYNDSLKRKTTTSLIYRILDANGEIRYIRSVGSFAENSRGQIVKIAVNYDITDQYKNTLELEENNRNLVAINAELESFNNIVSHDLQEPLRKIQMFISRIDSDEMDALSTQGRDYFGRIKASANRMQNLLIDLVNYSRTIKGELKFESCDLSLVIDEVKSELSLTIEEKNGSIVCGKLPVIDAISFQIQQLFINLVSNSLKFVREGEIPVIKIESVNIESMPERLSGADPDAYVCVTVSDNGIGFKQEFAEKIFQLFRRLEMENYQGTGIGLAICRKIVENHNGEITAEGKVGEGATFTIWLPKKRI